MLREGEERAELRRRLSLAPPPRPEVLGGGDVGHQHERELPLFDVTLDVGLAGPRRHVPVDRTHVVARHVGPDLVELHAAALED